MKKLIIACLIPTLYLWHLSVFVNFRLAAFPGCPAEHFISTELDITALNFYVNKAEYKIELVIGEK